ncbi:MAG: hypothetical protein ACRD2U_17005 [Terriglobales bacterium]
MALRTLFLSLLLTGTISQILPAQASPDSGKQISSPDHKLLSRQYKEGEKLSYHMKGTNQDRQGTLRYEVQADGVVKKNAAGRFIEEFSWSNLVVNDKPTPLSPASASFRQEVSLEPGYTLTIPSLSQVDPILIGPITDLLTFYADMTVAVSQGNLEHPADRFYFKHGSPNSWADGNYALIGEDSIDFDVALADVNLPDRIATVTVRHVPPAQPEVELPATWMHAPVADTPNNWVQVTKNFSSKSAADKYVASVGKETFDVQMKINLEDGRIISGSIDNPLEVLERDCSDQTASTCGDPVRYKIHRHIEIQ